MEKGLMLIAMMAVSNLIVRALPFQLLSGRKLPPFFSLWLKYVPVPVLAAMLSSDLLIRQGRLDLSPSNLYLCVSLPAFVAAYFSKNIFVTVVTGVIFLALARFFLGLS